MTFAKVFSAQASVVGAEIVSVEVDISGGLRSYRTVGLPDKAVEESQDRVSAALKNSNFFRMDPEWETPNSNNNKITVSLAPADIKKEGPLFDVPIAIAYLMATNEILGNFNDKIFVGELALDGACRSVRGVLAITEAAVKNKKREIFVPEANADEASLVEDAIVYSVRNISGLISHLRGEEGRTLKRHTPNKKNYSILHKNRGAVLEDIKGQDHAKRGLIIAAAGGHNMALYGPPGTGKTMLAQSLSQILPPLNKDEILEVTRIHSIAGVLKGHIFLHPPFRSPHHTSSYVSIVGGGTIPRPGEATLAHRGVLFLDEFPEFDRRVINALREPLEDGIISVSRAKGTAVFPSEFILVAAMNPCPCGKYGTGHCRCTPHSLLKYRQKISGPIMDRIDMWFEVSRIPHEELGVKRVSEGTETKDARAKITTARKKQAQRFHGNQSKLNAGMTVKDLENFVSLSKDTRDILNNAAKKLDLSPRAYHRVIKLARTIADLSENENVETSHILEALQYRPKEVW